MEMLLDNIKCEQLFTYNDDNNIVSITINASQECRLVFKNTVNNKYEIRQIGTNFIINKNTIKENTIYEYSIQIYNVDKFVTATKIYFIIFYKERDCFFIYRESPIKIILKNIETLNIKQDDTIALYKYISKNTTEHFRENLERAYSRFLYKFCASMERREASADNLLKLLDNIPTEIKNYSEKSIFVYYFAELAAQISDVFKNKDKYSTHKELVEAAENKIAQYKDIKSDIAYSYISALIQSLLDRNPLYKICDTIKNNSDKVILSFMDIGLYTFFDLPSDVEKDRRLFTYKTITSGNITEYGVILSVDIKFFKLYTPVLFSQSPYFSTDITFHIFIIGTEDEADTCKKLFNSFQDTIFSFTGKRTNAFLYHVEQPDCVKERSTLAACSRYMFAGDILDLHSSVYIMDADLIIKDNIITYFKNMSKIKEDIVIPGPSCYPVPYPWRRYIANNVYIKSNKKTKRFLDTVFLYCIHGLQLSNSWTLDQNALTYALSMTKDLAIAPDDGRRFTTTPNYRSFIESQYYQKSLTEKS